MNDDKVLVGLNYHEDVIQVCVLDTSGEVLGERRVSRTTALIFKSSPGHAERGDAQMLDENSAAAGRRGCVPNTWYDPIQHLEAFRVPA